MIKSQSKYNLRSEVEKILSDKNTNKESIKKYGSPFDSFTIREWKTHVANMTDEQIRNFATTIIVRDLLKGHEGDDVISKSVLEALGMENEYGKLLKPMSCIAKKYLINGKLKDNWKWDTVKKDILQMQIGNVYASDKVKHVLRKCIDGVEYFINAILTFNEKKPLFSLGYVTSKEEKDYGGPVARFIARCNNEANSLISRR